MTKEKTTENADEAPVLTAPAANVLHIVLEEIDRSIATSRYWGKDEVYSYLTELKQRIEYRTK